MKKRKRPLRKKKTQSVAKKAPTDNRQAPSTFEEISKDLKTAGWGKDKLTYEIEAAFCNIGVSFINLKPYFELLQKADEVFVDACELMTWKTLDGFITHSLFCRARGCFFGAVRLSCSGQLTETWVLLRALIENSLYGFYILGNPKRAEIWTNRHENEDSRNDCRNTFAIGKIFSELRDRSTAIAQESQDFYNKSIDWGGHPNERSLFPNIVLKQDDSGYALRFVNPEPGLIRATIIATIISASLTFRIFALVFPRVFEQPNLNVKAQNLKRQSEPLMGALVNHLRQLGESEYPR